MEELKFKCDDCGWSGGESELINSNGFGEGKYIEGECCPKCLNEKIEEIEPTDETT